MTKPDQKNDVRAQMESVPVYPPSRKPDRATPTAEKVLREIRRQIALSADEYDTLQASLEIINIIRAEYQGAEELAQATLESIDPFLRDLARKFLEE